MVHNVRDPPERPPSQSSHTSGRRGNPGDGSATGLARGLSLIITKETLVISSDTTATDQRLGRLRFWSQIDSVRDY